MTDKQLTAIVRGIMPVIVARVAAAELRLETKATDGVRAAIETRLAKAEIALEFKAAESQAFVTAIADLTKENAALRERVAVLETRPLVPGPAGKDGEPGPPGADGKAGLTYVGVYQDGKSYELGDVTTWAGSTWHCNEATTSKPGEGSKGWTLMVKRGRDGKDGKL